MLTSVIRGFRALLQPRRGRLKSPIYMWQGDRLFLVRHLVAKDFKVRYRNMSLGIFWSLLNPLVTMGVLTFVVTKIFANHTIPKFPLFVLCGIVPFNFFSLTWSVGTSSLGDNLSLVKRVPIPRELIPVTTVLANCHQLGIQILLLLVIALMFGVTPTIHWVWLPLIWALEVVFVCGLVLATSPINVYIRDTRYLVEATNTVLFWIVPIFYPFSVIPSAYRDVYQFNPIAAVVMASRNVLLDNSAPPLGLMFKLAAVSFAALAAGYGIFRVFKSRFYDYL